jgi:outer membrane biosynthesis protein TonB
MKVKKVVKPKSKPKPKPVETKRPPAEKPLKLDMTFKEALNMIATDGRARQTDIAPVS